MDNLMDKENRKKISDLSTLPVENYVTGITKIYLWTKIKKMS